MKSQKLRIYTTEKFAELESMHRNMSHMAQRFGVAPATVHNALNGKPVQASFVASVLGVTGLPFESLFEVR